MQMPANGAKTARLICLSSKLRPPHVRRVNVFFVAEYPASGYQLFFII